MKRFAPDSGSNIEEEFGEEEEDIDGDLQRPEEDEEEEITTDEFDDLLESNTEDGGIYGESQPKKKKPSVIAPSVEPINFWCENGFATHPDTLQHNEDLLQSKDGFEMMMIDIETEYARRKPELDQDFDLESIYETLDQQELLENDQNQHNEGPFDENPDYYKKRESVNTGSLDDKRTNVPIIKIYGREKATSASVCLNVYGFYPKLLIKLSEDDPDDILIKELIKLVRETTFAAALKKSKGNINKSRYHASKYPVLEYEVVTRFVAYPFREAPAKFIQLTFATPAFMTTIAKTFVNEINSFQSKSKGKLINLSVYHEIDYITQFQVEKKVYGFSWFKVNNKSLRIEAREDTQDGTLHHTEHLLSLNYHDIDEKHEETDQKEPTLPTLKSMCLDIECLSSKGFPNPKVDPIILICCKCVHLEDGIEDKNKTRNITLQLGYSLNPIKETERDIHKCFALETELLEYFNGLLVNFDPDFLIGHNIVDFDIKYIVERSNTLGCSSMFLGKRTLKEWRPPQKVIKRRSFLTIESYKTSTPGRIQLDTYVSIKAKTAESSYKLGALGDKYLGMGKEDVGYKMIPVLFETSDETRMRLAKYCMQDVTLTWLLCTHENFDMIMDVISFAQIARIVPSKLVRCGVQEKLWLSMYIKAKTPGWSYKGECTDTSAVFPSIHKASSDEQEFIKEANSFLGAKKVTEEVGEVGDEPPGKKKKYEGGFVMQPYRKFYMGQYVFVLDFKSLYPSIMIAQNICFSTLYKGKKEDIDATIIETSPVDANFVKTEVREGIIPSVLKDWLAARAAVRAAAAKTQNKNIKSKLNNKQLAIKICCNSFYGFTGASTGKIVELLLSTSVTSYGRIAISKAKLTAESPPYNFKVLYGDTDSIMVWIPDQVERGLTLTDIFRIMKELGKKISSLFRAPMEMDPEKVYYNYCVIDKKRYFALKFMSPEDKNPKIEAKGLESARRDTCIYLKSKLEKLMKQLATNPDLEAIKKSIHAMNEDFVQEKVPITELVVTKSITKPQEEYKTIPAHLELANRMHARDPSYLVAPGERIPYIIAENPKIKKDVVMGRYEDPLWTITHDIKIDYQFYLDTYIAPAMSRLLMWVFPDKDLSKELGEIEESIRKIDDQASNLTEMRRLEKPWMARKKKIMNMMHKKTVSGFFGKGALASIPRSTYRKLNTGLEKWGSLMIKCPSCQTERVVETKGICDKCKEEWKKHKPSTENPIDTSSLQHPVMSFSENKKKILQDWKEKEATATDKCDKCRGYSSTDIKCQQRDCMNLYVRATANKQRIDLEKLMKAAFS